jgi:hypothetical protein
VHGDLCGVSAATAFYTYNAAGEVLVDKASDVMRVQIASMAL